jgi:hypothetical protein
MQDVNTNKVNTLLLKDILKKTGTGGGAAGGLTNTELRVTPVPVSGTITVANPTAQGLTDTELRATALPVSIASMPSTPVTGTFYQATQPVSAVSLPLPTGATTETTLASASAKLPASLGTKVISASMAVNIASDQVVPISATALPLPTGASTSALQTTGNTSLSSLDTKLPAKGQAAMAASTPIVVASDQSTIPVSPKASTIGIGGGTAYKLLSAATTNAQSVKASAGQLYNIIAISTVATIKYLKFYNKASAPTVGTDTPIMTIPIPGNTAGAGLTIPFPVGINFSTGIAIAITGAVTDADTTAVAANDIILTLVYA